MKLGELESQEAGRRAGEVILAVDAISLAFGGVKALSEVSFDVREHEVRAIIGPNGAGKSSMLNVLNGVYHPQSGRITFAGETRRSMDPHHSARLGIARTFQSLALFKGMTVLENILAGRNLMMRTNIFLQALRIGPALKEEIVHRRRVEEIIDFLEIEQWRRQPVSLLPYGFQKRVELGRALAMEPELLLLDEPVAGMNLEETADMARFILDIQRELGITMVMVEHDMGLVMDIADRVMVLDFGEQIAIGAPAEVQTNPNVIAAYLGSEFA